MDENKVEVTKTTEEPSKEGVSTEKENDVKTIKLSNKIVNSVFAIAALFFMIVLKICTRFGASSVLYKSSIGDKYTLSSHTANSVTSVTNFSNGLLVSKLRFITFGAIFPTSPLYDLYLLLRRFPRNPILRINL